MGLGLQALGSTWHQGFRDWEVSRFDGFGSSGASSLQSSLEGAFKKLILH